MTPLLSRASLAVMISLLVLPNAAAAAFSDVSESHEHYAAVQWLESRGVIDGYEDGTFRPDQEVNRSEVLKIILLGSEITPAETPFTEEILYEDVPADAWFFSYVMEATDREIVKGYDDGFFRPEQTINLAEALKMITLVQGITPETLSEPPYEDVAVDAWFASYVGYSKSRHFIRAESDGYLHPDQAVTRGDLAEIMYRFSYTTTNDLSDFPIGLNWPLVQHETESIAFKVPFGWEKVTGSGGEVVIWHQDIENEQKAWDRTAPNSGTVTIVVDANEAGLSQNEYFDAIESGLSSYEGVSTVTTITETADDNLSLLVEYKGAYENIRDLYISLPDNRYAVVQATYGTGLLEEQLFETIQSLQASVYYSPSDATETPEDPVETIEDARAVIQVDGQGQTTLNLFSDLELIETDTIGVGTGPVDYYYSAWADVTLKYERSFDVILDIETGRTTAF